MLLSIQLGFGQDHAKKREKVEAAKIAHITQELDLSVEESQAFWPVYNKYQDEIKKLYEGRKRPPKMDEMTEEEANTLLEDHFRKESASLDLKKQMYSELGTVLPASKLVKLIIAEKKFRRGLLERIKKGKEGRKKRH
jgi:hypothetical protein